MTDGLAPLVPFYFAVNKKSEFGIQPFNEANRKLHK